MMAPLQRLPAGVTVTVKVPATSANLGPGFDSMGLALSRYDDIEVTTVEQGFRADVVGEGEHALPTDGRHMVITQVRSHLARFGFDLPGLRLSATNRIPHSRGLGSSAAAYVTAILIANALLPEKHQASPEDLLQYAATLEGHPDNVAPALFGGMAVSWNDDEGGFHAVRVDPHASITPVVAVPSEPLSTATARGLLPANVPHATACANAARAALLTHGLSHEPEVLLEATEDRLHQEYRRSAMPESLGLIDVLRAESHAAVVSGAGPTVLVLGRNTAEAEHIQQRINTLVQFSGQQWRVAILPVATEGAKIDTTR